MSLQCFNCWSFPVKYRICLVCNYTSCIHSYVTTNQLVLIYPPRNFYPIFSFFSFFISHMKKMYSCMFPRSTTLQYYYYAKIQRIFLQLACFRTKNQKYSDQLTHTFDLFWRTIHYGVPQLKSQQNSILTYLKVV